jgi:predicted porin
MRKLLLSSTALATAAALTAGAAVAETNVDITAATEWSHTSRSSAVTVKDGNYMATDSEVHLKFSNKTDSGLTLGYTVELDTDGGTTVNDESSLSISGGFGKIVLGNNDGAGDNYALNAQDLIEEENTVNLHAAAATASIGMNSDFSIASGDNNKISYHLPAMGGFTAGVSFTDASSSTTASTETDTTEYGFQYTQDVEGTSITLAAAKGVQETATAVAEDNTSDALAVRVVSGNISVIASRSTYKAVDEDIYNKGIGIRYDMGTGLILGAYTHSSDDDLDLGEGYDSSGVEAVYTIAAGLTAIVTVEDYEYKVDSTTHEVTPVADSGTISKVTLRATF